MRSPNPDHAELLAALGRHPLLGRLDAEAAATLAAHFQCESLPALAQVADGHGLNHRLGWLSSGEAKLQRHAPEVQIPVQQGVEIGGSVKLQQAGLAQLGQQVQGLVLAGGLARAL